MWGSRCFFKDKSASDMTNLRYVCVYLYSRGLVWAFSFVLVFGGSHLLPLLPSKMRSGGKVPPAFAWASSRTCGNQCWLGAVLVISVRVRWGNGCRSKVNKVGYPEVSFSHLYIWDRAACPSGLLVLCRFCSFSAAGASNCCHPGILWQRVRNLLS